MVKQKSSSLSFVQTSPNYIASKNYLSTSLYSAYTIRPFDVENTNFSYSSPIILLLLVSMISALLGASTSANLSSLPDFTITFFYCFIVLSIYSVLSAYIYTYLGCKIIGQETDAKHFGITASAYTLFPLVVALCKFKSSVISYVATFGCIMLVSYYINSTYQRYYPMGTDRIRFIYSVYAFFVFYIILAGFQAISTISK